MNEQISWQAPTHIYKEKTSDWYWIVGIVTVSISIISIILGNAVFAALILVASCTLSLFASKKPDSTEVDISRKGIDIGRTHLLYPQFESFWIETRDAHPRLILKPKKAFAHHTTILIDENDSEQIKNVITNYLPEEEHTEPLFEKLLIYLGF